MTPDGPQLGVIRDIVNRYRPDLAPFEEAYREIHRNAELSTSESMTANHVASFMTDLGFQVFRGIGGHGVAAVLYNGHGTTVLLRAELDALPIEEATGLPFASTKRMPDSWGREQPTMHACGHDLHIACLLASATLLRDAVDHWKGTLVIVFQPNEDGPFAAGTLNIRGGPVLVSADTVHVRLYSSLGHAANPQSNIDVVKLASRIILKLDSLAKEVAGEEYALVSVDQIHAGYPGQDWVSHADITLDVKTYSDSIRRDLLERIRSTVVAESASAGVTTPPEIKFNVRAPLTSNSLPHADSLRKTFSFFFGEENIGDNIPKHPCEDFSRLATANARPYVFWFFGREDPQQFRDALEKDKFLDKIPLNHSPYNAPLLNPSLRIGADALALASLSFLMQSKVEMSSLT
ncbi:hypothetical protein GGS24DRAFT_515356 [Hypoxylon argillaceum]|nr:hypothetical protein GGS24DRAFT_515356 [Hypoxylon argillaceum]